MRYLSSISLALIVLMALACSWEPAAPPAPSYPQISEDEAIALVKQHLQLMHMGKAYNCLGFLTKDGRYRESSPATAVERDRGSGVGCRTTSRPASVRIGIAPMPTKCPPTPVNATWLDRQDKVN
jgi:hypothetical protein